MKDIQHKINACKRLNNRLTKALANGRLNIQGFLNDWPNIKKFINQYALEKKWSVAKTCRVLILGDSEKCYECGNSVGETLSVRNPIPRFCCLKCAHSNEETNDKRRATNEIRYGGPSPTCDPKIMQKQNKTRTARYGAAYTASSPKLLEKMQSTCNERYGYDSPFGSPRIQRKILATNLVRYGHKCGYTEDVRVRREATIVARYGSRSACYTQEVKDKISASSRRRLADNPNAYVGFCRKRFELNGKKFNVAGYEHLAIKWLHKKKQHKVTDIKTDLHKRQTVFQYMAADGKVRTYIPDIHTPSTNTIYEVKSVFTLGLGYKKTFVNVKRKAKAVIAAGYNFVLLIVYRTKTRRGKTFYRVVEFPLLATTYSEAKNVMQNLKKQRQHFPPL